MTILSATVQKDTKDVKTGLRLTTTTDGITQIEGIAPSSLFANCGTPLHQGMRVVSVNNIPCDTMTSAEVTQIVREAVGTVVILVDDEIVEPVKAEPSDSNVVSATVVSSSTSPVTSTAAVVSAGSNRPPPGKAAGGTWGISKYFGKHSSTYTLCLCLLCFPFCFCMAFCPQDERDAYMIDGKVYDAAGKYLGTPRETRFKQTDTPRRRR